MATSITITLGTTLATEENPARTYQVQVLPRGANSAWKREVLSQLTVLANLVRGSGLTALIQRSGLVQRTEGDTQARVNLDAIPKLLESVESIIREVALAPDWCYHQVLAYAPAITADAAWVDTHATDDEVIAAFVAILRGLVIPLDRLMELTGLAKGLTQMNSPSANGTSLTLAAARKEN